jgi:hypothetical protein
MESPAGDPSHRQIERCPLSRCRRFDDREVEFENPIEQHVDPADYRPPLPSERSPCPPASRPVQERKAQLTRAAVSPSRARPHRTAHSAGRRSGRGIPLPRRCRRSRADCRRRRCPCRCGGPIARRTHPADVRGHLHKPSIGQVRTQPREQLPSFDSKSGSRSTRPFSHEAGTVNRMSITATGGPEVRQGLQDAFPVIHALAPHWRRRCLG